MKVFLTGATGFVGSHMLAALLEAGHEVQALVRPGSDDKLPAALRDHAALSILHGDALKPESLAGVDDSCEAVIHLIGIIAENLTGIEAFQRRERESG